MPWRLLAGLPLRLLLAALNLLQFLQQLLGTLNATTRWIRFLARLSGLRLLTRLTRLRGLHSGAGRPRGNGHCRLFGSVVVVVLDVGQGLRAARAIRRRRRCRCACGRDVRGQHDALDGLRVLRAAHNDVIETAAVQQ